MLEVFTRADPKKTVLVCHLRQRALHCGGQTEHVVSSRDGMSDKCAHFQGAIAVLKSELHHIPGSFKPTEGRKNIVGSDGLAFGSRYEG